MDKAVSVGGGEVGWALGLGAVGVGAALVSVAIAAGVAASGLGAGWEDANELQALTRRSSATRMNRLCDFIKRVMVSLGACIEPK